MLCLFQLFARTDAIRTTESVMINPVIASEYKSPNPYLTIDTDQICVTGLVVLKVETTLRSNTVESRLSGSI